MKKFLPLIFFAAGLLRGSAQGTLEFGANLSGLNELPAVTTFSFGAGAFSLTGSSLSFNAYIEPLNLPTGAGVYGPADASQNGSLIFDLGAPFFEAPGRGFPGSASYYGSVLLTGQQIGDLKNGRWYVNIFTDAFPNGEVRGQITPVPEPSTLALFSLLSVCGLALHARKPLPAIIPRASGLPAK